MTDEEQQREREADERNRAFAPYACALIFLSTLIPSILRKLLDLLKP